MGAGRGSRGAAQEAPRRPPPSGSGRVAGPAPGTRAPDRAAGRGGEERRSRGGEERKRPGQPTSPAAARSDLERARPGRRLYLDPQNLTPAKGGTTAAPRRHLAAAVPPKHPRKQDGVASDRGPGRLAGRLSTRPPGRQDVILRLSRAAGPPCPFPDAGSTRI